MKNKIKNYKEIKNKITDVSKYMFEYLDKNPKNEYLLYFKKITHSDLVTSGKRTRLSQSNYRNYLYYKTKEQLDEEEKNNPSQSLTAHQSNITISKNIILDFLDLKTLKNVHNIDLHNYCDVLLMNDTLNFLILNIVLKYLIF